jgi:hypothetical protein
MDLCQGAHCRSTYLLLLTLPDLDNAGLELNARRTQLLCLCTARCVSSNSYHDILLTSNLLYSYETCPHYPRYVFIYRSLWFGHTNYGYGLSKCSVFVEDTIRALPSYLFIHLPTDSLYF